MSSGRLTSQNHLSENFPSYRKAPQAMGASRDYTTGNPGGIGSYAPIRSRSDRNARGSLDGERRFERPSRGITAVLEREPNSGTFLQRDGQDGHQQSRSLRTPVRPEGLQPTQRPLREYQTRGQGQARSNRLGSDQVVSWRGHRVGSVKKVGQLARLSFISIGVLVFGVVMAMWLSGISTSQTFRIQQLTAQESTLSQQLETLNRDLENVRSSADVARRAAEDKMGVPEQAGVVAVQQNGDITSLREAKPETESIIDVNGAQVQLGQASSNPTDTANMAGQLHSVPQGQQGTGAAAAQPSVADAAANQAAVQPAAQPAQAPYAARRG